MATLCTWILLWQEPLIHCITCSKATKIPIMHHLGVSLTWQGYGTQFRHAICTLKPANKARYLLADKKLTVVGVLVVVEVTGMSTAVATFLSRLPRPAHTRN